MLTIERDPWRGPREDSRLFQFFVEGTIIEGDLVLDCTTATGKNKNQWYCINASNPAVLHMFGVFQLYYYYARGSLEHLIGLSQSQSRSN